MNFAKTKTLIAAAALLTSASAFANINTFNRSLPNQAGVGFDYVVDTWDFNTVPGFYAQSDADNFSMVYGASELDGTGDAGEAAASGRITAGGLPLFWAVAQRNSTTSGSGSAGSTFDYKYTKKDYRTTAQVGTLFGNFGVGVFADLVNTGEKTENHDLSNPVDGTNVENKEYQNTYGVNVGQSTEGFAKAWTFGLAYTMLEDTQDNNSNTGYDFDDDGTNDAFGPGSKIDAGTEGWVPFNGEDFIGWAASFSYYTTEAEDKTKYSGMEYVINPFYTRTLKINDDAVFYLNPGLSFEGKNTTKEPDSLSKIDSSNYGVYFTLPIMFQVPVTQSGSLKLQAGVSPKVTLYNTGTKQGGSTTTKGAGESILSTADLSYGFGATYSPSERLSLHALFNTTGDEVESKFAFGVDYKFATSSAPAAEEAEM